MQGWSMSRCTSACLLILALSAILFPQLRQLYLTGPPASLLFDISPSKTLFRSRIMKLLYLWYKGQKMCCMEKPLDQNDKYLKKSLPIDVNILHSHMNTDSTVFPTLLRQNAINLFKENMIKINWWPMETPPPDHGAYYSVWRGNSWS